MLLRCHSMGSTEMMRGGGKQPTTGTHTKWAVKLCERPRTITVELHAEVCQSVDQGLHHLTLQLIFTKHQHQLHTHTQAEEERLTSQPSPPLKGKLSLQMQPMV